MDRSPTWGAVRAGMRVFRARVPLACVAMLAGLLSGSPAAAQTGTGFSFQGRLYDSGVHAAGPVSLRITPWDAGSGGTPLAAPLETGPLQLEEGTFTTTLDFGPAVFLGAAVWLEIEVDTGAGYVALQPRQPVSPTPYALHAERVAVDAVDRFALQDGAVSAAKIAPGAVGGTQVDSSEVQLRIAPCAAGMAIASVAADGTPGCVPLASGEFGWAASGSGFVYTDSRVRVGGLGATAPKMSVYFNSGIHAPQLNLVETELDYSRLSLTSQGTPEGEPFHSGFWTIAALTGPASMGGPDTDRINFFNNRSGDAMSLLGNGWLGVGQAAFTPLAPLMVASKGFYAPGVGPHGRGDLYVGNGTVGLSLGVATGGGGEGAARIWTDGGLVDQLFLGSSNHGDVLAIKDDQVGVGTTNPTARLDVAGAARVRSLADPGALFRRPVYALSDGTLATDAAGSHTLLVDAVALTPDDYTAEFHKSGVDFNGAYGYAGAFSLWAPVELPDDAVITEFACMVRDNSSASFASVRCELVGRNAFGAGGPSFITVASVQSSITSSTFQLLTDTTLNGPNVDNDLYAYFVHVASSNWEGPPTAVLGLRITYTR